MFTGELTDFDVGAEFGSLCFSSGERSGCRDYQSNHPVPTSLELPGC